MNLLGSVFSEGIPRNPKTYHVQEHMREVIGKISAQPHTSLCMHILLVMHSTLCLRIQ